MEKKYCLVFGKVLFLPQEPAIAKKVLLGLWKSIVPPSRTSYRKKSIAWSLEKYCSPLKGVYQGGVPKPADYKFVQ